MILGTPNNLEDYICVNSELSTRLYEMGFIPIYREIDDDKIYYIKSKELENIVKEFII